MEAGFSPGIPGISTRIKTPHANGGMDTRSDT